MSQAAIAAVVGASSFALGALLLALVYWCESRNGSATWLLLAAAPLGCAVGFIAVVALLLAFGTAA